MNTTNLFLKVSILLIITGLLVASYFLYQFLFQQQDPLLQEQMLPIPTLDLETYQQLINRE